MTANASSRLFPFTISVTILLVAMAAVARVMLPWLAPAHTAHWWVLAATAWTLAFGLYLWVFTPWLLTTRLDGKDG